MIRIFDLILSLLAIVLLAPLLLLTAIFLKLTGEGKILYLQKRIGVNGKEFKLFKFATMLQNSPSLPGGNITKENDPRILPLGHFLRKTKINELPQLLNVVYGSMSIIGPRPMTIDNFLLYPKHVQVEIRKFRPGLSGVGSIIFRNEEKILARVVCVEQYYKDSIAPYKAELEMWFCKNRSIGLYFKLIVLTVLSVMKPNSVLIWILFPTLPKPDNEMRRQLTYQE